MQSPPKGGSSDVLHVQYWVVGSFKVKDPGGEAGKPPGSEAGSARVPGSVVKRAGSQEELLLLLRRVLVGR